ncbi:unnamed protein product [Amoebophrya sp. A120]|nr:unnamed protein product [Amoebophrya sp. A120]|eukprot:GSA120T00002783001.1
MRQLPSYYIKGKFIGKGGFARCYELTHAETNEVFAVKIVSKASISKPRAQAKLKSEISIHRSLNHEKVVRFYEYYEDQENVYIILELCPNQTLNEFLRKRTNRRMAEPEAMFYIYDLILALKYLHKHRILHRDLKLGNLFLDDCMRIKIGDFGLAAQLESDDEKRRTICGTPNYIAPEILDGKTGHSYEVDVWSLGVILYTMLIGKPPFETSDVKATYRKIRYNQYSFPDTVAISEQAKLLIQTLLQTDPRARPQLDEVMHSKWLTISRLPPPIPQGINDMKMMSRAKTATAQSSHPPPQHQAPSVSTTVGSNTNGIVSGPGSGAPVYNYGAEVERRGAASSRSETPDRALDFARLDSPCPRSRGQFERYPMRERSPSLFTSPGRGSEISKRSNHQSAVPSHHHGGAPGSASGRPPLYNQTTHDQENVFPPPVHHSNNAYGYEDPPGAFRYTAASSSSAIPNSSARTHNLNAHGSGLIRPSSARPPLRVSNYNGATSIGTPRTGGLLESRARANSGDRRPMSARVVPAQLSDRGRPGPLSSARGAESSERKSSAVRTPVGEKRREDAHFASPAVFLDALGYRYSPTAGSAKEKPMSAYAKGVQERLHQAYSPKPVDRYAKPVSPYARVEPSPGHHQSNSYSKPPPTSKPVLQPQSTAVQSIAKPPQPGGDETLPELWVTKWVDYSSKYGIGYVFSDHSIGVYFNDSTKIILESSTGIGFEYITRRTMDRPEQRSRHTLEDYPDDLRKKVTLLKHFKNYLLISGHSERKDNSQATLGESGLVANPSSISHHYDPNMARGEKPYVKKWMKNRHAIMFQLSNKIVQVIFFDKTEVVLSSKTHTVTYVDKRGQRSSYPLQSVMEISNTELAKRLRYTKDILVNLLSGTRAQTRGDGSVVGS